MLNVPLISERLLSRISLMRKKRDPFTRNKADRATSFPTLLPSSYDDNDDQDAFGFRGALRYLANEDFTIDYSFDYLEHDQHTPAFAVSGGSASFLPFKETDNGDVAADGANLDREIVKQHSLNMEWQASENLTLRSITGWRRYDGSRLSDLDGTTLSTFSGGTQGIAHFRNKVWTRSFYQELQLVGTTLGEQLDYTLGFNWFEDESEILNRGEVFNTTNNNVAEVKGDNYSWGLYGQMNYRFTERLELTLGLRYSKERREAEHSLCRPTAAMLEVPEDCPNSGLLIGGGDGILGLKDSVRFDNWSPMARLSYDWTDDVMTYLSWSRGYRAGGFPNRPADGTDAAFTPYKEETISQWEIGLKSRFLGDRLQLNGSAYYSEYEDQQVSSLLAGSIVTKTENAGKSRLRGWELEARAVPLEGLELRVAHGYTNTDFSEFGAVDMMGNPINIADQRCVCQQPKRTWSGWATYTLPTDLGTFQLTGSFRRNSWAAFDSRRTSSRPTVANIEQSSFTVYGAQARLLDAFGKEGMSIAVIGRNITDTVYAVNGIDFAAFQGLSYGDPRHWIVEVGYEF
jgi:iron complex outermembrane receptor protein